MCKIQWASSSVGTCQHRFTNACFHWPRVARPPRKWPSCFCRAPDNDTEKHPPPIYPCFVSTSLGNEAGKALRLHAQYLCLQHAWDQQQGQPPGQLCGFISGLGMHGEEQVSRARFSELLPKVPWTWIDRRTLTCPMVSYLIHLRELGEDNYLLSQGNNKPSFPFSHFMTKRHHLPVPLQFPYLYTNDKMIARASRKPIFCLWSRHLSPWWS